MFSRNDRTTEPVNNIADIYPQQLECSADGDAVSREQWSSRRRWQEAETEIPVNYPCMVAFTEVVDALMGDLAAHLLVL